MWSTEPKHQGREHVSKLVTQMIHDFEAHKQHEQDEYQCVIMADALANANLAEDAEEYFGVKGLNQNSITNYSAPDHNSQRVMEPLPEVPDPVPATPILQELNDMNGRWTYSQGDHIHFVRVTQTD